MQAAIKAGRTPPLRWFDWRGNGRADPSPTVVGAIFVGRTSGIIVNRFGQNG